MTLTSNTFYRDRLTDSHDKSIGSVVGCGLDRLNCTVSEQDVQMAVDHYLANREQMDQLPITERRDIIFRLFDEYVQHQVVELNGFRVVDATSKGARAHDDLIWVSVAGEGRWMSPEEAVEVAATIAKVAAQHMARRKVCDLPAANERVLDLVRAGLR